MMISFGCHNLTYQCPVCEQEIQYSVEVTGELEGNPVDGQVIRMAAEPHTQPIALHYKQAHPTPEPEPQPTAAEVLRWACHATEYDTPERGITLAAMRYAEAHPEWFADWHTFECVSYALLYASNKASAAGNRTAYLLLSAAAKVAGVHPELFGGAA